MPGEWKSAGKKIVQMIGVEKNMYVSTMSLALLCAHPPLIFFTKLLLCWLRLTKWGQN